MKKEKKTGNAKLVSLHPLKFEDALKELLQIKPEKKKKKEK